MTDRIRKWFRLSLDFLNVLEDDRGKLRLSISKVFMWSMIWSVVFILHTSPDNVVAVITASGTQLIATINYMYRRRMEKKNEPAAPDLQP